MALSEIQILRLEHGDTDIEYPILTDEDYQYYIDEANKIIAGFVFQQLELF